MTTQKRSLFKGLKPLIFAQALLVGSLLLASAANAGHHEMNEQKAKDIVGVATSAGQFNTLAAALEAAGLVETLQGKGPFTVFAPTDAAFAKLPEGTVEMLLKPENREKLVAVLSYHVVPGAVTAKQVVTLTQAPTVNGKPLTIDVVDGKVRVDGATVVKADIEASNGIIHVIDEVVLPRS